MSLPNQTIIGETSGFLLRTDEIFITDWLHRSCVSLCDTGGRESASTGNYVAFGRMGFFDKKIPKSWELIRSNFDLE